MSSYLHAFGAHLPERVVTNAELAERVGRTGDWIESVSGIRERRWAAPETTVADMGVAAAETCLRKAGISTNELGMLMVASGSGARGFPGPAAEVADRLCLSSVPAVDLPIASAGSLFGLALAMRLTEAYGDVLVVAAEKMSDVVETDPNTAILFGDGAGAALVSVRPGPWRMLDAVLHTDGQYRGDLACDQTGVLRMNGLAVILQAARKIPSSIEEVLRRQNISAKQVAVFLLHQANLNLLTRVAKALGVGPEKVFANVQRYGNTSSASMLIAAAEWSETNSERGPIVFSAFGAGFHWGALVADSAA
ncbi:MAG: 3-oxoacyl-(acyl-carrier-protein) synthase [Bryobacterales bacterium]|nr:3-oxoacyl-(acyl-carrier-protein) synthase [Bryobacterales bacterium]